MVDPYEHIEVSARLEIQALANVPWAHRVRMDILRELACQCALDGQRMLADDIRTALGRYEAALADHRGE